MKLQPTNSGAPSRSSHKAGQDGTRRLGALVVRAGDVEFNIGTGFSDDERRDLEGQGEYLGRIAKFKYFSRRRQRSPSTPSVPRMANEGGHVMQATNYCQLTKETERNLEIVERLGFKESCR